MRQASNYLRIWLSVPVVLLSCNYLFANSSDSGARVARITLISGDVQIRHAGSDDWEVAAPNLPLLAGDKIATGDNSRTEIQFDNSNFVRVASDSLLKVATLNDDGVALALPEGTMSLQLADFRKNHEFFEIDTPQTTISADRRGLYRVDEPAQNDSNDPLRLSIMNGGEADVNSQFGAKVVENDQSARIFQNGDNAGEFDVGGLNYSPDRFDNWVADRSNIIARRRAAERAYYDAAILGADELGDYGVWVETANYGRVWRPAATSINIYENWAPYRYGHWRDVPGFGWTWVADEPWGWATSHYGRWVWAENAWAWTPRSAVDVSIAVGEPYRPRWEPSLVVFANTGSNVSWYPVPYNYAARWDNSRREVVYENVYNRTVVNNYNQTAAPGGVLATRETATPVTINNNIASKTEIPAVYANAVSQMPAQSFGKANAAIAPAPPEQAKTLVNQFASSKLPQQRVALPAPSANNTAKIAPQNQLVNKQQTLARADKVLSNNPKIGAGAAIRPNNALSLGGAPASAANQKANRPGAFLNGQPNAQQPKQPAINKSSSDVLSNKNAKMSGQTNNKISNSDFDRPPSQAKKTAQDLGNNSNGNRQIGDAVRPSNRPNAAPSNAKKDNPDWSNDRPTATKQPARDNSERPAKPFNQPMTHLGQSEPKNVSLQHSEQHSEPPAKAEKAKVKKETKD